jgi:hypothetical protein
VLRPVSLCRHAVATAPAESLRVLAHPAQRWQPSLSPEGRLPH